VTNDRRDRPHLRVISEETPPPSQANDALVVGSAIIAALAGIGFAVGLALHTSIVVYGSALAIGLLALCFGVRRYFADQYPDVEAVESRHVDQEPDDPREPISDVQPIERRSLMRRALIGASGIFGLSLLAPVPSLGPAPGAALTRTAWRRGTRLVTTDGAPIRAESVAAGGISTVWPEGAINNEISAVIVVRLRNSMFEAPTNPEWVVNDELVAYSKVCTHAGCPVGLFRERDNALFCPCHQSTFDAVRGAMPTFGPTARALPQLPLGVDQEGFLIALGDFTQQVGPAYG
jgi:ubiquinol-cytochrome c reductase iron-sulfur subunit